MPSMTKPAWQIALERDGYVIVPNAIPKAACEEFCDAALDWLESFPHGFSRADRSTWTEQHLPYGAKGGLYNRYAVNHEDFVWKIRTQPGIRQIFEQIWSTDDLIASFDGMNASLPINAKTGRSDIKPTTPWPHIDQNPRKVDRFELYQGIANLAPNGPDDGGLVVMKGSHKLHEKFFASHGGFKPEQDAGVNENGYNYQAEENEWFRSQGCEEVKICADAGSLILWDSRTIHWNASPVGNQIRFVTYVCYCPRSMADENMLAQKKQVFESRKGTTHWPNMCVVPADRPNYFNAMPRRPDGTVDPANRARPSREPEVTPEVLRLVGVRA